ncbi:hypothetical protein NO2_0406 [Candidatus Termititenax persephonae]|uniref:Uncharacterized protein n=1 Tax=Candidatus Termititenax persephonae TaxID=2218525 RepID=A0A388THI0_9BACT|nr:hypothetical protein NO2_0406 [Candidatus Termititenax persephonae]
MDNIQQILNIIACVMTIAGGLFVVIGRLKKWLFADSNNAFIAILRSQIYQIYEQCKPDRKISIYKFSTANSLYDAYKKLGGNGFIQELMIDMNEFKKE